MFQLIVVSIQLHCRVVLTLDSTSMTTGPCHTEADAASPVMLGMVCEVRLTSSKAACKEKTLQQDLHQCARSISSFHNQNCSALLCSNVYREDASKPPHANTYVYGNTYIA